MSAADSDIDFTIRPPRNKAPPTHPRVNEEQKRGGQLDDEADEDEARRQLDLLRRGPPAGDATPLAILWTVSCAVDQQLCAYAVHTSSKTVWLGTSRKWAHWVQRRMDSVAMGCVLRILFESVGHQKPAEQSAPLTHRR